MSEETTTVTTMRCALVLSMATTLGACSDGALPPAALGGPPPGSSPSSPTDELDAGIAKDAASPERPDAADGGPSPEEYQPGPSICDPAMSLGPAAPLVASALRFGAVSGDDLTLAWITPGGDDDTAGIAFADRAAVGAPFGPASDVGVPVARDGVALSPDGLDLLAVAPDRRSFVVFSREARGEAFHPGAADAYDAIADSLEEGELLSDPVFGYGDHVLVYSVYGGDSADTVRFATRLSSGSPFSPGVAFGFPELRRQGELRRRPTGLGADFQTLFFWDEVSNTEKLGRLKGTIGFFGITDLGEAYAWAQPNEACSIVYFGSATVSTAAPQ